MVHETSCAATATARLRGSRVDAPTRVLVPIQPVHDRRPTGCSACVLLSLFVDGASVSYRSCFAVGGPDRPIPEPETQSRGFMAGADIAGGASSLAAAAAATQTNLYGRLTSALNERGCVVILFW